MAPPASLKVWLGQSRKIDRAPQAPEPALFKANAVTGRNAARTIGSVSRAACVGLSAGQARPEEPNETRVGDELRNRNGCWTAMTDRPIPRIIAPAGSRS
jgi:hypothetical protein